MRWVFEVGSFVLTVRPTSRRVLVLKNWRFCETTEGVGGSTCLSGVSQGWPCECTQNGAKSVHLRCSARLSAMRFYPSRALPRGDAGTLLTAFMRSCAGGRPPLAGCHRRDA